MDTLRRFHEAQAGTYADALAELKAGRKRSHWMWFIFPQLRGLARSPTALHFGIADPDEARAYVADPVLRERLLDGFRALLAHPEMTAEAILGPVDALKLRSSATLFRAAGDPEVAAAAQAVLDGFYGGQPCKITLAATFAAD